VLSEKRKAYLAVWREKNRDKTRAAQAKYYKANKELCDTRVVECTKKKSAYYTMKAQVWQRANPEKVKSIRKKFYRNHSGKEIERQMRRLGRIRQGQDLMTPAEWAEVEGMYLFCKIFPKFEVDHKIPLNGKTVSGLHVLANLQVLERSTNRSKGNKLYEEYVNG